MILKSFMYDITRKKGVAIILFLFIFLSALLISSGSTLICETGRGLRILFEKAQLPDYVQMHAGDVDRDAINRWAQQNSHVSAHQVAEMITVDGSSLVLNGSEHLFDDTVMDISFVTQNNSFDYLLTMNNQKFSVAPGEVGVPLYFHVEHDIAPGDTLAVRHNGTEFQFTVAGFVRDALMNPSIVHSKRFLVHENDYARLSRAVAEYEYLIEFMLQDQEMLDAFASDWEASGLPAQGPAIDRNIVTALNGISEGIVAAAVIFLSLLILLIALLCLRFIIIASIEEEIREIGIMKAVGLPMHSIRRFFMAKYIIIGFCAVCTGALLSLPLSYTLTSSLRLYAGSTISYSTALTAAFSASLFVLLVVTVSCLVLLRRLRKISPVAALQSGAGGEPVRPGRCFTLSRLPFCNTAIFLSLHNLMYRKRQYLFLAAVYAACVFVLLIPVHFLSTIQSPRFISYMGIGNSDMRIDLRNVKSGEKQYEHIVSVLDNDPAVKRYTSLVTAQYSYTNSDGARESITIESGDFTMFPLRYLEGRAPEAQNELALSLLYAQEMKKKCGDTLPLYVDGEKRTMQISGVYQDITNGGKTAKAVLPVDIDSALRYTICVDLTQSTDPAKAVRHYASLYDGVRVTDIEGYLHQTLGETIHQLKSVTGAAVASGAAMALLISVLFLKMMTAKESAQTAILKATGFSAMQIRMQYMIQTGITLAAGITAGTLLAHTAGERLVGFIWSFMGASQIEFVIRPLLSYLLLPGVLIGMVVAAAFFSTSSIRKSSITRMILE